MLSRVRVLVAAIVVLALGAVTPVVRAAAVDPAAVQIQNFDAALIDVMKQAQALGPKGRARKLTPVIDQTFDLASMIRFAVGPSWASMSDADHAALIDAFRRFTAASYAHNFNGYSGERFSIDPKIDVRGPDKIVRTYLTPPHGDPVLIAYRMRATTGAWKVIDVYYQGTISQLTTSRSDFASAIAAGGARALIDHLNTQTEKLLQ